MAKVPTVKPVTRYRVPRYPDFLAPNPSVDPDTCPYPFRKSPALVATALGICLTSGTYAGEGETTPPVANPLTVAKSGLPHVSSPYGTGQPQRLSDNIARSLINQIFAEEGIKLEENVTCKKGDAEFVATGYNKEKKIGYVWGGWDNLDESDAIKSWRRPREGQPVRASQIERIVGADYKKQIEAAEKIKDEKQRNNAFKAILKDYDEKRGKTRISLAEAKTLERDAAKNKEYIAVISQFDKRFSYTQWQGTNHENLKKIAGIKDPKKRAEAYKDAEEETALNALKKLEEAVRGYIKWAQTQGF